MLNSQAGRAGGGSMSITGYQNSFIKSRSDLIWGKTFLSVLNSKFMSRSQRSDDFNCLAACISRCIWKIISSITHVTLAVVSSTKTVAGLCSLQPLEKRCAASFLGSWGRRREACRCRARQAAAAPSTVLLVLLWLIFFLSQGKFQANNYNSSESSELAAVKIKWRAEAVTRERWSKLGERVCFLARTQHLGVCVCWHELIAEECAGKWRNRKSASGWLAQSSHTILHSSTDLWAMNSGWTHVTRLPFSSDWQQCCYFGILAIECPNFSSFDPSGFSFLHGLPRPNHRIIINISNKLV